MLQHDEMHKRVVKALTVMLIASLLLVTAVFTVPTPALASGEASQPPPPQPDVICQLCQWYYFCYIDYGSGTICNGGQRYICDHVKACIDGCASYPDLWGFNCYPMGQNCSPNDACRG